MPLCIAHLTLNFNRQLSRAANNMVLKYYFDLMSQPCRALWLFLKANNIPFEECPVALRKGNAHAKAAPC